MTETKLGPLCSVPYDRAWPQQTRLRWIAESAAWWRSEIPRCKANLHTFQQQLAHIPGNRELTADEDSEAKRRGERFKAALQNITKARQAVSALWAAALVELPKDVTRPLNALRDGMTAFGDDDRALLADLATLEDEARRLAAGGDGNQAGGEGKPTVSSMGPMTAKQIAEQLGTPEKDEAIRQKLNRLMNKDKLPLGAFVEVSDPPKGSPRYLFHFDKVRPFLVK